MPALCSVQLSSKAIQHPTFFGKREREFQGTEPQKCVKEMNRISWELGTCLRAGLVKLSTARTHTHMNIRAEAAIQRAQKYAKYFSHDSMHTDSSQHLFVCMRLMHSYTSTHTDTHTHSHRSLINLHALQQKGRTRWKG